MKIEDGARNMRSVAPGSHGSFVVADPGFVKPGNDNYRLRGWSTAINLGGQTEYLIDLGNNPAAHGPPDAGAFEFVGWSNHPETVRNHREQVFRGVSNTWL